MSSVILFVIREETVSVKMILLEARSDDKLIEGIRRRDTAYPVNKLGD